MNQPQTVILQARMASHRLPGKVMLPVLGRPLLAYNVERILRAKTVNKVVVATSTADADDAIAAWCHNEGIALFRGSPDDVLGRLLSCVQANHVDVLIRLGADNPLIDAGVIDAVIGFYLEHQGEFDYVSNNHPPTWPDGMEVEIMPRDVLELCAREAEQVFQREHATPFVWDQPDRFRIGNVALPDDRLHAERWTLDYPEDYAFIRSVLEALYPLNPYFEMADIFHLLERQPNLRAHNAMHAGDVWYAQHMDRLKTISSH